MVKEMDTLGINRGAYQISAVDTYYIIRSLNGDSIKQDPETNLAYKNRPHLKPRSCARSTATSTGDADTIQAIPGFQPSARRGRRAWRPARRTDERTGSAFPVPGWLANWNVWVHARRPRAACRARRSCRDPGVSSSAGARVRRAARHLPAGDRVLSGVCRGRPCRLLSADRDKATTLRTTCRRLELDTNKFVLRMQCMALLTLRLNPSSSSELTHSFSPAVF
jgi:hypothetical protein